MLAAVFNENKTFYPTPESLADKMARMIDIFKGKYDINVLEPSAGKGDLIKAVHRSFESGWYSDRYRYEFHYSACEIDPILRNYLKGVSGNKEENMPEINIVGDDFLQYDSWQPYDVIIMNPPFANGDKHLLHAIELMERNRNGGQIICVLNAETLRNLFSNTRKELAKKLDSVGAEICYMQEVFEDAERPTSVEIALVSMSFAANVGTSHFWENCVNESNYENPDIPVEDLAPTDFFENLVARYNIEVSAGMKLLQEYQALKPYILNNMNECDAFAPTLEIKTTSQEFIENTRYKYWKYLFTSGQFTAKLTNDLQNQLYSSVKEMKKYDFSLFNIRELAQSLLQELTNGIDESIMKLFDKLSAEHSYYNGSDNCWYYNGWKTNKAHKVNSKVIIPAYGCTETVYDYSGSGWSFSRRQTGTKFESRNIIRLLDEIEKIFDYLDMGETYPVYNSGIIQKAAEEGKMRNIQCKYFKVTFYKKGTAHIDFAGHERILRKLNVYAAKKRCWLPPTYGAKHYEDMNDEERVVVDEFQGSKEYEDTMADAGYYLAAPSDAMANGLLLGA